MALIIPTCIHYWRTAGIPTLQVCIKLHMCNWFVIGCCCIFITAQERDHKFFLFHLVRLQLIFDFFELLILNLNSGQGFPWAHSTRGKPRRGMMRRAVFSGI
jgi:hypothetical protein